MSLGALFGKLTRRLPQRVKVRLLNALVGDPVFAEFFESEAWSIFSRAPWTSINAVRVNGEHGQIIGSPADRAIFRKYFRSGSWAPFTNELLCNFFEACGAGAYVDVGANIGLTTIPVARNPKVQCYAFEPGPENYLNLVQNVLLNCPHGNVRTQQIALFNAKGTLPFALSPDNFGDNRIKGLGTAVGTKEMAEWQIVHVRAAPLDEVLQVDEILQGSGGPLAVKIDTQGAEPQVVAGGEKVFSRAELLIIEWSPYLVEQLGGDINVVVGMLLRDYREAFVVPPEACVEKAYLPVSTACDKLMSTYETDKLNPGRYFDIVARK